jgi:hypothetical protein
MYFISSFIVNHKKKVIVVFLLSIIAYGSTYFLGPNNAVEEGAESILKQETGLSIDFDPVKK